MSLIWKTALFLLRRGPAIYQTGQLLRRSMAAAPALAESGETLESGGGTRLEAVEQELRAINEERVRLSGEVERLSKEIEGLRGETERARDAARLMSLLFLLFVVAGLLLGAVILSRFP